MLACSLAGYSQVRILAIDADCRAAEDDHPASKAVAGLDVAPGLEATLFAAEPMLASPTNIDVDDRGRVWVCEVVNYRHRAGERPAGDRILILEDTDGDGRADKSTVFYQGRDIDSAMGICVLGNRVIVTASPNVFVFTDTDGDGKADKKELLFTKTGQPQHDHSAHTFIFGPDGRLYWNFGNAGKSRARQGRQAGRRHFRTNGRRRRPSLPGRHGLSLRAGRQQLRGARAQLPQQLRAGGRLVRPASGSRTTTTTAIAASASTSCWNTATTAIAMR